MSRNPIARDLRTPKYRERVIADKRLAAAEALDQAYAEAEAFDAAQAAKARTAAGVISINGVWHCPVCGKANLDEERGCYDCEVDDAEWEDLQRAALNRGQP